MSEELKVGIQETKDVAVFMAKLGVSIAQCAVEKKFQFKYFIDDIESIPAALSGITHIPAELKDLESEEMKEVLSAVVAELAPFGIDNSEAAKKFISAGINFAEGILDVISGVKALKQKA